MLTTLYCDPYRKVVSMFFRKRIADKGPIAFPFSEEFHMAVRSTTSQFQPIPPNYTTAAGVYRNVGRYRAVNSATQGPVRGNMSTAPVNVGNTQYFYVPRLNG